MNNHFKLIAACLVLLTQAAIVDRESHGSVQMPSSWPQVTATRPGAVLVADTGDYYVGANRPT